MTKINVGIIRFPGSNCDRDIAKVLNLLNCSTEFLWHKEGFDISAYDLIVLPGGFSFGDYEGVGVRAAKSYIMKDLRKFAEQQKLILGICNGFQILTVAGLLPGHFEKNKCGTYYSDDVFLRVENKEARSSIKEKVLKIPIANGYGNYQCSDKELQKLRQNDGILLRYCTASGDLSEQSDPTGSREFIAGIKTGNIWGLMPHPERAAGLFFESSDGIGILRLLLANVQKQNNL